MNRVTDEGIADVEPARRNVLGMQVDQLSSDDAIEKILSWSNQSVGRYVCVSNVHQCMETLDDGDFRAVVNGADLVVPDSQILVWSQMFLGFRDAGPVIRGVELMGRLCERAALEDIPVGLYGGTESSLQKLQENLQTAYPGLSIVKAISPPFRPMESREEESHIAAIRDSGARLLFVGIGCPKQENWMARNRHILPATMIGVGAAFDFLAGVTKPSPSWVHPLGLEWLYRLCLEPRRLGKRYLKHNPRFIAYLFLQRFGWRPAL